MGYKLRNLLRPHKTFIDKITEIYTRVTYLIEITNAIAEKSYYRVIWLSYVGFTIIIRIL